MRQFIDQFVQLKTVMGTTLINVLENKINA